MVLFNVCNGFVMQQAGQLADKFRNFLVFAARKKTGKIWKIQPNHAPAQRALALARMLLGWNEPNAQSKRTLAKPAHTAPP